MSKVAEIIGKVIGGSSASIIDSVSNVVDNFTISKEEKAAINQAIANEVNRHLEAMADKANKELELNLADTQNARDNNSKIQESEKASWVAKNFPYFIGGVMVVDFFVGLILIMQQIVPEANKELFYTGFGLLGGFVSTVMNYYFGSSSGSKASNEALRHIVKNK